MKTCFGIVCFAGLISFQPLHYENTKKEIVVLFFLLIMAIEMKYLIEISEKTLNVHKNELYQ